MRFLFFLRDTVLPYILLITIVGGGLGGATWLVATTYFWDTSQLTITVDDDVTSAEIRISSRVVYHDLVIFGVKYPFHIIFPWSKTVSCKKECIFLGLPRGDAEILFTTENGVSSSAHILIEPDTQGKIDLRSVILIKEVISAGWEDDGMAQKSSILPADISPRSIFYKNAFQGLLLFWDKSMPFLYDMDGKQIFMLPKDLTPKFIVRWIQAGEYYLVSSQDEVWLYDRYGRQKTEKVLHSTTPDGDIIWEETQTRLKIGEKEQILPGRLFWWEYEKKNYLFDGKKVFEIINT